MTCIVSYKSNGKIYIGGDSGASENNNISVRNDVKVFKINDIIIGYAGSFRCAQLVKFSFNPPKQLKTQSNHAYMCATFIPELHKVFDANNVFHSDNKSESELQLLIAYKKEVYLMDFDFNIGIPADDYASIGASSEVATGALYAITELNPDIPAADAIKIALDASVKFTTSVKPPYTILHT